MKSTPQRRPAKPRKNARRKRARTSIQRILAPVDFSEHSREAVQYAVSIGGMQGAQIELLHVVEPMVYVEELALPSSIAALDSQHQDEAAESLAAMADKLVPAKLKCRLKVVLGHVFSAILKEAEDFRANLMVVNTHGYTGLQEFFMGGTAEKIARHAPCPVLVVKPKRKVSS